MIFHILKYPSPDTLARCEHYADDTKAPELKDGWEAMTREDFEAWQKKEIENGWKPATPSDLVIPPEPMTGEKIADVETKIAALQADIAALKAKQ